MLSGYDIVCLYVRAVLRARVCVSARARVVVAVGAGLFDSI